MAKSQRSEVGDEELVEQFLNGGPRVAIRAYHRLADRQREGHDIVRLLPPPEGLDAVKRHQVSTLVARAIPRRDGSALLGLLSRQTEKEMCSSLLDWGNTVDDQATVDALVDKVIELLGGKSADVAVRAAYALTHWCSKGLYQPWDSGRDFSAALTDRRKAKGWPGGVGGTLVPGFVSAASRSKTAPKVLAAWLAHPSKEARTMAAELETWRILALEGEDPKPLQKHLTQFLGHRDAAVRAGVVSCLEATAGAAKRAEALLAAAFGVPEPAIRTAVAKAVAHAQAPGFKPSQEVAAAIKGMSSTVLSVRRQAAGACAGYAIDAIDCRGAAPHLAMALADPDEQVRKGAASSLTYLFDMQGNLDVARVTLPCLRKAHRAASGEVAKDLARALAASR